MVEEHVDVTASLRDELSRPAGRAENSIEDLRQEVDRLSAALTEEAAAERRAERAARAHDRAMRQQTRGLTLQQRATERQTKAQKALAANTDAARGKLSKATSGLIKFLKITAGVTAVTYIAAAISSLGAAAFAAIAGLSPLVGVFGALPGVVLAAVSGLAAAKLATMGLGDALKVLLDPEASPEKVAEEMNKLSVGGQALARTLAALSNGPFSRLKRDTANAIAPGLIAGLRSSSVLAPILNRRLRDTSFVLGDLAKSAGDVAETGWFRGQLARIMRSNNVVLENGGKAGGFMALALLDVVDAARPMTEDMSRVAVATAEYISNATEAGRKSGELSAFFMRAWTMARQVGHALADVAVILYNVGSNADSVADKMGGGILARLQQFRDYTSSIAGQDAIGAWFENSLPLLTSFMKLLANITLGFGALSQMADLSPVVDQINSELVPAFKGMSSQLSTDIAPALVTAATAAVKFLDLFATSPAPEILSLVASAALQVVQVIGMLPGPVKFAIAGFLALATITKIAGAAAGLATAQFAGLAGAVTRTGALAVTTAIQTGGLSGAMVGLRAASAGVVTALGGPWVLGLLAASLVLGKFASNNAAAKQQVENLTSSLDESGNVTEDTVKAQLKALDTKGDWMEYGKSIGLSVGVMTSALLGSETAMDQVRAAADKAGGGIKGFLTQDSSQFVNQIENGRNQLTEAQKDAKETAAAVDQYNKSTADAGRSTAVLTANARVAEDALNGQGDAADSTKDSLIALNKEMLGQQRTYIGFRQSVADARKTLMENKKTLDRNTQAGRDNRLALLDVAEAASSVENAAQRTRAIAEARKRIAAWADSAGMGTKQAKKYADSMFDLGEQAAALPPKAGIDLAVTGSEAARNALLLVQNTAISLKQRMDALRSINPNQIGNAANADRAAQAPAAPATPAVPVAPNAVAPRRRARRDGGAVWPGEQFTVGEVGPELYVSAAGISVIGGGGQETKSFAQPGYVLPNEAYRAAQAAPERAAVPAAPVGVVGGQGLDFAELAALLDDTEQQQIHNHFHGDLAEGVTLEDVERVTLATLRKHEREKRERR